MLIVQKVIRKFNWNGRLLKYKSNVQPVAKDKTNVSIDLRKSNVIKNFDWSIGVSNQKDGDNPNGIDFSFGHTAEKIFDGTYLEEFIDYLKTTGGAKDVGKDREKGNVPEGWNSKSEQYTKKSAGKARQDKKIVKIRVVLPSFNPNLPFSYNMQFLQFKWELTHIKPGNLKLSSRGRTFVASYEGLRTKMYDNDGSESGNTTIGIGHLVHLGKKNGSQSEDPFKNGLSEDEVFTLFEKDIASREKDLNRLITKRVTQEQFDALFSIYYHHPALARKLIKYLNNNEYVSFSKKLESFKDERYKAENNLFFNGEYNYHESYQLNKFKTRFNTK